MEVISLFCCEVMKNYENKANVIKLISNVDSIYFNVKVDFNFAEVEVILILSLNLKRQHSETNFKNVEVGVILIIGVYLISLLSKNDLDAMGVVVNLITAIIRSILLS
ncbi:hypothetical protein DGG96_01280 [Legionella qingyii]|uniref:Uncharacterized protein n=1 Tax=Legionella qingyii TaxID=2184757 RepID=A0A317U8X3_9GAMM|nr:hypothetical protein DGG96_01280 [Legionella qingyii]